MKVVIVFLISLLLTTGCGDRTYKAEESENVKLKSDKVLVYSDVKLLDLLDIDNNVIEIISENKDIDTEKLGKETCELIYRFEGKKYSYKFTIDVVDTEAPRVFSGTNKTVDKGYTGDLCNLISYGDNYDGDVKCTITGEYDLNTVGTYNLEYLLLDSSNNEKKVNVTLNVQNPSNNKKKTTQTTKTQFADILSKHKNEDTEVGIDVSKWQGDINFEKVKNAGASFVMMRIGVQTSQNGELYVDSYYLQNIKKAKEAGLKVGVYLYSIATSKQEAIEHANWVVKTLDGEELELPIVFDWENWSKWNTYKLSFHEINEIADTFIETVNKAGYEGMLYSSKFYLENIWENKNKNKVWLAHYTDKTSYEGDYIMWQLSNTGRIDGIYGDVDLDILYNKK